MFYITLIQISLISFKLTETLNYSWWLILTPLIAINIASFCIAFKREYYKARNKKYLDILGGANYLKPNISFQIMNQEFVIATGEKLIRVQSHEEFMLGMAICIEHDELNKMVGFVKDYENGVVNLVVTTTFGHGIYADWHLYSYNKSTNNW